MDLGQMLAWFLDHLNYWTVTLLMIMENSVFPLPAELIVTPAAYKAAQGEMNIIALILLTTFGSLIGAIINYYIAMFVGRPAIYRFVDSRLGRACFLSRKKMEYVENLFLKHGNVSTFIGRLLPMGRQLISIPAGLARMNIKSFAFYTFFGSAIWNSFLMSIGYVLAGVLPEDRLVAEINRYSTLGGSVFLCLVAVYLLWRVLKSRRRQRA